jgi:hypothetical protein
MREKKKMLLVLTDNLDVKFTNCKSYQVLQALRYLDVLFEAENRQLIHLTLRLKKGCGVEAVGVMQQPFMLFNISNQQTRHAVHIVFNVFPAFS